MLTVVFPLSRAVVRHVDYETNNAVIDRPDGIFNSQTWVNAQTGDSGFAILNRGTSGVITRDDIVKLILMRSVVHYRGYYSPSASEAGNHTFEYSIYPHNGGWQKSNVVQLAHSFNRPFHVISTDEHQGSLPSSHSFISVEQGSFEITAFKKAENGVDFIIRGYETKGSDEDVQLDLRLPFGRYAFADLLERTLKEFPVEGTHIRFNCQPFE